MEMGGQMLGNFPSGLPIIREALPSATTDADESLTAPRNPGSYGQVGDALRDNRSMLGRRIEGPINVACDIL
jgi:hypothetical protein